MLVSGLANTTTIEEGDDTTVSCSVDRIYPNIRSADFQMGWGLTKKDATEVPNPDRSFMFTVQMTKPVDRKNNGDTVSCAIFPTIGTPILEARRVNVQCKHYLILVSNGLQ